MSLSPCTCSMIDSFDVGAHLATPLSSSNAAQQARTFFPASHTPVLESWIDEMERELPPLRNFVLPSGGPVVAQLHVCRAVCRRSERHAIPLVSRGDSSPTVSIYLNRLSDFFFVAARHAARVLGEQETIWKKPREARVPPRASNNDSDAPPSP